MLYVGVDHHKRYCQLAVVDEQGALVKEGRVATDRDQLAQFLQELAAPCAITVEAGRTWGLVYDWLEGMEGVAQVQLAHPAKVKAIAWAKIKTDTIDARTLAQLLRVNLLPTAHIPSRRGRALKNLLRPRIFLVMLRTMLKNRIHDLVDRHHLPTEQFSDLFGVRGRRFLQEASEQLPAPDRELLRQDLELLDQVRAHIRATEGWLKQASQNDERVAWVRSLPGIGKFLALVIIAEIDTIERFATPQKLASYAGLVPATYASGGRVFHGRLTKQGNKYLRWAFVEAAWPAIRRSPWLRSLYERVKARHGATGAKAAVARKLCELVWYVLKERRVYEERGPRVALCAS
uniref:Transposase protein n=1 Tax=Acetithermum autotrophicum TaxID=1446466 RepID=H5STI3_ACEAU|nr:transposase protein [Candidatus Acetothermum autotrophicum]